MEAFALETKWKRISHDQNSEFVFSRIDSVCIPELYIGLNSSLKRCLLLELPHDHAVDFQPVAKQNLLLELYSDPEYIVLQLTDDSFYDLFNDLIISLYQSIKTISDISECSSIFIRSFHKWSQFFHDKDSNRLTENTIKGLFGELIVLRGLLEKCTSAKINDLLDSWKGPYDQGHDFVLGDKNIEVKTKDHTKSSIRIASEQQLDEVAGKALELLVISVERDFIDGFSIGDVFEEIKDITINRLGDYTILLEAIRQKGLTSANIKDYDNFRFIPIDKIIYDCSLSDFPKLVRTNIPAEVCQVRYSIQLTNIDQFIISKDTF
jgi:hypothetical protein